MREKGKTRAINRSIAYFDDMSRKGWWIPFVIFLDADCEFFGNEALINFSREFKKKPELCAVAAECLPDVYFNGRGDWVAEMYRAIYNLRGLLKMNSISGMCYAIRFDVLREIKFPEFQFAEDMFVSARLDGWFLKDKEIIIVFKTPTSLSKELKRRVRQEVSTQRYHQYYSELKRRTGKVKIFEGSLGENYRWSGAIDNRIARSFFIMKGLRTKLLLLPYLVIIFLAKIRAHGMVIRRMRSDGDLDYWEVSR
jgi:hypothetical protein